MADIKSKIIKVGSKVVSKFNSLSQAEQSRSTAEKVVTEGMPEILRYAASQGAVLLKNKKMLPLKQGTKVSLFGRVQNDWFYTGYGSGGDVNKPYAVNLIEGIRNCDKLVLNESLAGVYEAWCEVNPVDHGYWGNWPRFYPEMPLTNEMVKRAGKSSDCAVVVLGRSSGEDRENALEKGSYYITDEEKEMLGKVTEYFDKVAVLLNIGSIIDMAWLEAYGDKISAVMIV